MSYQFEIDAKVIVSNPNIGKPVKAVVIDRNNEIIGASQE